MTGRVKVQCPLCNSNQSFDLTNFFSSKDAPISICKRCSLVFLNPRHSDEWYKSYYKGSTSREKDNNRSDIEDYESKQYEIKGKSVLKFIMNNYDLQLNRMKVLEIGCTSGGILRYFRDSGASSVTGVDPEKEYVDYANNISGIDVFDGYLDEFCNKNKDSFNLIIMRHVLEHLFEPLVNLELVYSLLDDNGILFIETPSLYSMGITDRWKENIHVEHPVIYSNKTLECMLKKCNFDIIARPNNGNRGHLRFLVKKNINGQMDFNYGSWIKVLILLIAYELSTPLRKFYYFFRKSIGFKKT